MANNFKILCLKIFLILEPKATLNNGQFEAWAGSTLRDDVS